MLSLGFPGPSRGVGVNGVSAGNMQILNVRSIDNTDGTSSMPRSGESDTQAQGILVLRAAKITELC